jgi:hypothetical protein
MFILLFATVCFSHHPMEDDSESEKDPKQTPLDFIISPVLLSIMPDELLRKVIAAIVLIGIALFTTCSSIHQKWSAPRECRKAQSVYDRFQTKRDFWARIPTGAHIAANQFRFYERLVHLLPFVYCAYALIVLMSLSVGTHMFEDLWALSMFVHPRALRQIDGHMANVSKCSTLEAAVYRWSSLYWHLQLPITGATIRAERRQMWNNWLRRRPSKHPTRSPMIIHKHMLTGRKAQTETYITSQEH